MSFTNPVYRRSFPDPFVLEAGGSWYAYATNGRLGTLPVLCSADLVSWTPVGEGMPHIAPWSEPGRHWAPEVTALGGRYLAYYTATVSGTGRQGIGVAVADSPTGPFRDAARAPLLDQADEGGSIDASAFTDADGTRYLLWKNDGNHVGVTSWIYLQRLSADGLSLAGQPTRLVTHDQPWEGHLVEGPFLWRREGRYYLFYSANDFGSAAYGVGYAVADHVLGPYIKPAAQPLMASNQAAVGPGHGMVLAAGGQTWYVHHAWPPGAVGAPEPGRQMWLTPLDWTDDGVPVLAEPSYAVDQMP